MMDPVTAQPTLKSKLGHIKLLLDDANHRLRDEADIFTTKTSASVAMKQNQNDHLRPHLPQAELRRTIADISTIQSVLSCPIFNQIANVTDSLDKLTYHLNLRPSIGPVDIEFNKNGELVLAPPVEPTSLNNLINSQLDEEYSNLPDSSQPANQSVKNNSSLVGVASNATTLIGQNGQNNNIEHQFNAQHQQQNAANYYTEFAKHKSKQQQQHHNNEMIGSPGGGGANAHETQPLACNQNYVNQATTTTAPTASVVQQQQQRNEYNTEKLLGAEANQSNYVNGARRPPTKVQSTAAMFESAFSATGAASADVNIRGLYKANGHAALNQMAPRNSADTRMDFETTRSMSQINEQSMNSDSSQTLGYSNDMYRAAHEVASADNIDATFGSNKKPSNSNTNGDFPQQQNTQANCESREIAANNGHRLVQQNSGKRASPATSAGSNGARLADECDSGTSSFRSKGALYSPQSHKPIADLPDDDPIDSSIDQELIEKLSPEMERIKVTLEKDSGGLGITIAGYMCEKEEISGIFIKSITPGSPADRSGKIRVLDQIFAVNGKEILGYSNPDAVNVLRQQSRVVTLDLMRYLAEAKYKKLQTLLEHAAPSANLQKSSLNQMNLLSTTSSDVVQQTKAQPVVSTSSPKRVEPQQSFESMYNNSAAFMGNKPQKLPTPDGATSPIPAQRTATGTTSKVIETKQGARNKIEIRSPLTTTTTTSQATYVNEITTSNSQKDNSYSAQPNDSMTSAPERLRQEFSDDLYQPEELKWSREIEIVELRRDPTQSSLGFTLRDYANPQNPQQSILMIVKIARGGIAEQSGQLAIGDLLKFVDDTNLENSSLDDAVRALHRTSGQVRLGILKFEGN